MSCLDDGVCCITTWPYSLAFIRTIFCILLFSTFIECLHFRLYLLQLVYRVHLVYLVCLVHLVLLVLLVLLAL